MIRSLCYLVLLAVTALAGVAPTARAQRFVRLGQPGPVVPTSPGEPSAVPSTEALPALPAPSVLPVRPMTLNEFAGAFKPLPGRYEVLLQHPRTCCPVKVCFTLPPGCVRKVRVNARRIEFVYARQRDVVIRFLPNGNVLVRN